MVGGVGSASRVGVRAGSASWVRVRAGGVWGVSRTAGGVWGASMVSVSAGRDWSRRRMRAGGVCGVRDDEGCVRRGSRDWVRAELWLCVGGVGGCVGAMATALRSVSGHA